MLVTKHATELCALLVNDLYGELPSRIIAVLLKKGRSTISQLAQYTSLTTRLLRHGLGVLFQHNLVYTHFASREAKAATYDANPTACYNLIRSGKILEVVEKQYGTAERDLIQTLLLFGHTRIADLEQAFTSRGTHVNGSMDGSDGSLSLIQSSRQLHIVLAHVIQIGLVETVRPDSFRNPIDVYHEIEQDVTKSNPGEKASKRDRADQLQLIGERFRSFRDQGGGLKRQLDCNRGSVPKRRKLGNGTAANGDVDDEVEDSIQLDLNMVVRLNHEKCLVELRNQKLVEFAADALGPITAEVYRALLELLTADLSQCRVDPFLEGNNLPQRTVTSLDILDHLSKTVNMSMGIGKAPKEQIDFRSAEKIYPAPRLLDGDSDDSDDDDDDEPIQTRPLQDVSYADSGDNNQENSVDRGAGASDANCSRETKVKFDDQVTSKNDRLESMRQHLLLLAESKHRFLRHCGTLGRGQWTIDFAQVLERLGETELDAMIEQSFGRQGLRLTRILREKGKLDEKMLQSAAFMSKTDVLSKMLSLQMAGVVDVQEVPKDNSRMANRTMYFWFFDKRRMQDQLLDDIYKAMIRALETLQVERHKQRNILAFVERKDVEGKEEEVIRAEHYHEYNRHLEVQNKLLGQVMRLDDLISVFRDF